MRAKILPTIGLALALVLVSAVSGDGLAERAAQAAALTTVRYVTPTGSAGSNTCTNPANPCALQHAINQAASGDEIRIAGGTYNVVVTIDSLKKQIAYITQSITLRGGYSADFAVWDPDVYPSVLSPNPLTPGRCIYIAGGAQPLIEWLVINNGNAAGLKGGPGNQDAGGGVYVANAAPTLRHNTITGNRAQIGGGVWLSNSSATLANNAINSNTATYYGGGVGLYQSAATLRDNIIDSNTASGAAGGVFLDNSSALLERNIIRNNHAGTTGGGGRIINYSAATLRDNDILNNNAAIAGGGLYLQSPLTLTHNTVTGNTAGAGGGGGIYVNISSPILTSNTIAGNTTAGDGGGVYLDIASPSLVNTWLFGNQAAGRGSGIYMRAGAPSLRHTTLARNTGGDGSGVHVTHLLSSYSSPTLVNTILVSHTVGITVAAGCTATLQGTLWGGGAWANGVDWSGAGTINRTGNVWGDPLFVDAAAGNYHLGDGSPAIDAGVDSGVAVDADDQARPHYGGYDLGADEWWPLLASKTVAPLAVAPGALLTYTVVLSNVSGLDLAAQMGDALHPAVDFVGPLRYETGSGGYASGVVTWTGTVSAGVSVAIVWAVQVEPSVPTGVSITNTAVITDPFGVFSTSSLPAVTGHWVYLPLVRRSSQG